MESAETVGQKIRIEKPGPREIGRIVGESAKLRRIVRLRLPAAGDALLVLKLLEAVGIRKIGNGIADGRFFRKRFWIVGKFLSVSRREQEQTMPVLWNAVVGRVQNVVWKPDAISQLFKGLNQLVEKLDVLSDGKPLDILENAVLRPDFPDDAEELLDELIAGVVKIPLPDHREALARRSAEDDVDIALADARYGAERIA